MYRCITHIARLNTMASLPRYSQTTVGTNSICTNLLKSSSLNEFESMFINLNEPNLNLLASVHKFVLSLINKNQQLPKDSVRRLLQFIKKADLKSLKNEEAIDLINLVSYFAQRGLKIHEIKFPLSKLIKFYCKDIALNMTNPKLHNLNSLLLVYKAAVTINQSQQGRTIIEQISIILSNNRSEVKSSSLTMLLTSLRQKKTCSRLERSVRKSAFSLLSERLSQLQSSDLIRTVKICHQIKVLDFQSEQWKALTNITKYIIQEIPNLEKQQVMELLQIRSINECDLTVKFYKHLLINFVALLTKQGQIAKQFGQIVSQLDMVNIIGLISNKVTLSSLTEKQEHKVMLFVEKYVASIKQNRENTPQLCKLYRLIFSHKFINSQRGVQLLQICAQAQIEFDIITLFLIKRQGFSVKAWVPNLVNQEFQSLSHLSIVKLYSIIQQGDPSSPQVENLMKRLTKDLGKIVESKEEFTYFIKGIGISQQFQNIQEFHRVLSELVKTLPSPFDDDKTDKVDHYLFNYMSYMLHALPSSEFIHIFTQVPAAKSAQLLFRLIRDNVKPEDNKPPLAALIHLMAQQTIESKESSFSPQIIHSLMELLNGASEHVVRNQIPAEQKQLIIRQLFWLVREVRKSKSWQAAFNPVIDKYLLMNQGNYNVSYEYRSLVAFLAGFIGHWEMNTSLVLNVVEEGCRLNVLASSNFTSLDGGQLNLKADIKQRVMYTKDQSHQPIIRKIILHNPNLHHLLTSQMEQVKQVISSTNASNLVHYLVLVKNTKKWQLLQLIQSILTGATLQVKNFATVDIFGIMHNLQGLQHNRYYAKFVQEIINDLVKNIPIISFTAHIKIVAWLKKFVGIKPQQYLKALVRSHQADPQQHQILLVHVSALPYAFTSLDLNVIAQRCKNSPIAGLKMFLLAEEVFQPNRRRQILATLCHSLMSLLNTDPKIFLPIHFYRYIKSKYSEETSILELAPQRLKSEKLSVNVRYSYLWEKLKEVTGWQVITGTMYGQNPYYLTSKYAFLFIQRHQVACYNQSQLMGRIIRHAIEEEVQVITLSNEFESQHISRYISHKCGLNSQQAQKFRILCIDAHIKSKKRQGKAQETAKTANNDIKSN